MINRVKTYIILLLMSVTFCSCGGNDSEGESIVPPLEDEAPSQVETLIYPSSDLLCISNIIKFEWTNSFDSQNDAIKYRITIYSDRGQTDIVKQRIVDVNSATIILDQGKPFYWNVIAIDNKNNESKPSVVQAFHTSGTGVSNHAPFSSVLVFPELNGDVDEGKTALTWLGSDPNVGDILIYELFFGETESPPLLLVDISENSFEINTVSGKTYYWKVNTIDDSGVKSIGQVWNFTTN